MVNSISFFWIKYLFANASTGTLQGHTTNASVKIILKTSACYEILINNTQSCCALVLMKMSAITLTVGQLQLLQQDLLLAVRAVLTIHAMRILPSFQLYQFAYHRAIFCLTWFSPHSLIASPSLTPGRRPSPREDKQLQHQCSGGQWRAAPSTVTIPQRYCSAH